ncbi:putative integrase [Sphingobium sp. TKS]|nr:putative integrase [Sphingobium sp. TKS]
MCCAFYRAMAATLLNENGRFHPDAIERQLAHVERDGVRRAYTRGEYWNERVTMMQWWSGELDRLSNGSKLLKPNFRGNVQAQEDEGQSRRFAS